MMPEKIPNKIKSINIDIEKGKLQINGEKYEKEIVIGVPSSFDAMDWTHRLLINSPQRSQEDYGDMIKHKDKAPSLEVKFTEGSGRLKFISDIT